MFARRYLLWMYKVTLWFAAETLDALFGPRRYTIRRGFVLRLPRNVWRIGYYAFVSVRRIGGTGFSQLDEGIRELDQFIASCTPGMQYLNCGAHLGIFAITAAHYGGETARCYGFEPSSV